ncbi:efflux RND transporter permease subunit [Rossellomorea aquimaris]|uniref:Efflux RND transporter permease subunit n=1 Tax=Rossellomorea aquimaris TaxID=189382 RepID=A0A5D4UL75_9BACI|nr:efflux RND transporter permease subunit [Rossellomorea aquimaris]TYS81403.1 efflux RND transporter permease subunit [Rossellomorea aquimaris]TYS88026.1 efflux RND transporter permease subunit [Rossellomorea aquimaris]
MNSIINFVLKNKFAVWLMTIIVIIAGLYSGFNMKLETLPNINTPIVSVTTVYPGATPEDVAEKVSEPIEKRLKNLNGVNVVSSTSYQNASAVQIEYKFSKDMDEAKTEVEDALSDLTFPEGVNEPEVSRLSFNAFPIIALSVANDDQSLAQLTSTVEETIVPQLEGVDGVASVQVSGQQVQEAQVVFDQEKLVQYGLTEETVQNMIKGSDVTAPLGLYTFKDSQKSVMVDGNITTIEDLKEMKIPVTPSAGGNMEAPQGQQPGGQSFQGQPVETPQAQEAPAGMKVPTVQLSDIADIELKGKAESISRTNGKESIGLQVVKTADANTVDVVNAVKEEVKDFEKSLDGVEIISTFDQGEPIEESVSTMLNKALFGAIFAVIIILLFLRDIKSTLISVVSIPLSLLIAILLLKQMDITLNIMTLGAMTVAIGRVIDDSIVVVENIYRRMSLKGELLKGKELIREATKEMFVPIASSTIVTIAVFLPLGLVQGMIGELFLPFALTIVFALLASLLVAVTIVPMLAHSMFKKGVGKKHVEKQSRLAIWYKGVLNWTLNHKIITSLLAVAMLVGSLFLVPLIGVSFLPSDEEKMIMATYKPEPGQTEEEVNQIAQDAEEYFQGRKGAETIQYSVGGENPMSPGSSNNAIFYVQYSDETENFSEEKEQVIKKLQETTDKGEWASQDFSASAGSNEIVVYVYGETLKEIEPVVNDIQAMMKDKEDFKKVGSSISESYDEYSFIADQEKLSELGLTAGQIAMELGQTRQRPVLTTIEKDGEEVNVYLDVEKEEYESINDLTDKTIQSPLGIEVPIKDVVEVQEGKTSDTVSRRDGKVFAQVSGELKSDDVSKASQAIQKEIEELDLPEGINVDMGGVTEDIQESFTQLGLAMLAAIAIVYLILVITFGGGLAPFAILFSLPFTIIGALVGLLIAGETISISSMIGALMLIGIVVTNAIVLIDRVIHKENEGLSTREALLEAGATRLRPILMTAIATIGALFPLALGLEGSGLISKGLGVTVIGGLTSSTLLTLVVVPIVYEILMKIKGKIGRRKRKAVKE